MKPALTRLAASTLALAVLAWAAPVMATSSAPAAAVTAAQPLTVVATPIPAFSAGDLAGRRYGRLEFRGGIELRSANPRFGGLSSLILELDGRHFLTLSDHGDWFAGELLTEGDRPTGMANVTTGPLRDQRGRTLASFGRGDTESLARLPGGFAVGIERVQEIWFFPGSRLAGAGGRPWPTDGQLKRLAYNNGIEALMAAPLPGLGEPALIAVGESDPTAVDSLPGFIFAPRFRGSFSIARSEGFDATDMALGPDGMVYLLERRFSWLTGVGMRLRRFPLAEIRPGARIEGDVLITAGPTSAIDNMEGLAVTRNAAGEIILTLISDDNFNHQLQRTVLLRFAVIAPQAAP
ncbi:esterase-like activity of phytase family protein [Ancylobacter lacus]|uniref:esterase-like activity of phytase family protein n=1 Tax=Ancylobacter lacus TaxID=2579970 RepID=UPI001BCD1AEC|nr:esterase-like activity of phytase family protein [Ancylobacter lacus]MBS7537908.1 esterase-like activity of phytase family protein [Ancylobacter lacus]